MSKPKIGEYVRYTDHGRNVFFQLNKRFPKNDGVLGRVESFGGFLMDLIVILNGKEKTMATAY